MIGHNRGDGAGSAGAIHQDDYVVEWSERQLSFHVTTIARSIRCNFHVFLDGRSGEVDYRPIFMSSSHAAAHEFIARVQKFRDGGASAKTGGPDAI
ncbi:MAG: hypothetical protein EXS37_15100 [Opitutus sp.]|nr:hypothetical protein [Opitutus sp.]